MSDPYDPAASRYHDRSMWAFYETDKDAPVDTFFVCPTAVSGDYFNMPLDDAECLERFTLQTGNQKGIYDDETRFFAPFYSQATMACYAMSESERENYLTIAYRDIKDAFSYYLHQINNGNGIILAGSSQGADMILRLLRDFFREEENADKLVCCYAIGRKVTEDDLKDLGSVHFAYGETDTASVVSFNTESPAVTESFIVGKNEKTLCINPLNWVTDPTPALPQQNLGCCIYSTKGYQKGDDLVGFCGAYIDTNRGTLKATDIDDPDGSLYPSRLDGEPYGVYHIYDWEFFYRNLEKNAADRVAAYLNK